MLATLVADALHAAVALCEEISEVVNDDDEINTKVAPVSENGGKGHKNDIRCCWGELDLRGSVQAAEMMKTLA